MSAHAELDIAYQEPTATLVLVVLPWWITPTIAVEVLL